MANEHLSAVQPPVTGDRYTAPDCVPAHLRAHWRAEGIYPHKSLFESFLDIARSRPLAVAVTEGAASLSFAQLRARSLSLAQVLHQLGVGPGVVVAVNLPNGWRACAVDLAVAALGGIVLPYPLGRRKRDTLAMLGKSAARVLICKRQVGEADYAALVDGLRPALPALAHVLVHGERYQDWLDLDQCWEGPAWNTEGQRVDPDAGARLIASSGSESEPKLMLYSHNALVGGQSAYLNGLARQPEAMRALFAVPLASPFGSLGTPCTLASLGGALICLDRFEADAVLRLVAQQRVTHLFAGPNMVDMLLASPLLQSAQGQALDFSALEAIVSGGSALSAQTLAGVRRHFGCALVQSYGSADGVACHTALDDAPEVTVQTVGRPDPAVVSLSIRDEQGHECAPGEVGEIWARGPMTPLCYYRAPELDRQYRHPDGWVRLGDRGQLDADGRLRIVGRRADTVMRGGHKVNLVEVAHLLREHPAIAQCVVLNAPLEDGATRMHAFVVMKAGQPPLTLAQVRGFLNDEVGAQPSQLPDALACVPELPLAPSGKVDQAALLQSLQAPRPAVSAQPVIDLLMGVERAGVLRAAIELQVFDHLGEGASARTVAERTGASERGTRILLDALAGLGLLRQEPGQAYYRLGELAERFLRRSSPHYVGGLAQVYTADLMWDAFRHFKDAVVAGGSVLPQGLEAANHPYWGEFSRGIANTARVTAQRLAQQVLPWLAQRQQPSVLDLACGNGTYGFTLAAECPAASLCGVDWPASAELFWSTAETFGVRERTRFIGADIFTVEPGEPVDLIILSQVLHHFDEAECRRLLGRLQAWLKPGGRLLIAGFMRSDAPAEQEPIPRLFAAQMLSLTEAGDCHALSAVQRLLEEQGWQQIESAPLRGLPIQRIWAARGDTGEVA